MLNAKKLILIFDMTCNFVQPNSINTRHFDKYRISFRAKKSIFILLLANSDKQIVIRTCTLTRLLDSDGSHSSFTLKLNEKPLKIVSGTIESCKDDGCNKSSSTNTSYLIIFSFMLCLMYTKA
jgi:hypothetical protein